MPTKNYCLLMRDRTKWIFAKSAVPTLLYKKKYNPICHFFLAFPENILYTSQCCDMIAMKREVAAHVAGFPWSECQVRKLTTSHCTDKMSGQPETTCCDSMRESLGHTRESVQSPLVVLKR